MGVDKDEAELASEGRVHRVMADNLPGADLVVKLKDQVCGGGVEHELIMGVA